MSKTDNLSDFLTDVADAIRAKKGTTEPINPQNFSSEIASIEGGGGKIKITDGTKFQASSNLDWINSIDTSQVTNMSGLFQNCWTLSFLDLSSFDTSHVTSMVNMFSGCEKLTSLDLSSFDTSQVDKMAAMFYNCSRLISIDLSSFDTSQVDKMDVIFYNCSSLKSLKLGTNFGKAKVSAIDLSPLSSWTNDTVASSLSVMYDRAANGMSAVTLKLHANTKAVMSEELITSLTNKGYTIA